ncbi:hypothetical protein D9623_19205 [Azospirillum brasilense]|uniref:Uncharacterized protein n=1 Tax=Azospirillum brasilense TaxID=192 RepID=A0A0P0FC30_AZOBR|nr:MULTISPECIES: hypothetical protein [Azospirillum]ALJ37757.1 hypothetical protein AMK58_20255 [Azospirillum brasilense]MDW7556512.1 hypothetical protein [Azospirillum brasilense]MDW7592578.1 hypothetical protein [Azospirillum brasilense]MDW7628108.1 hypothetical protein [Azospirillum brasilense]MDX5952046.1 hypothetical protein [Azospirillum brasilense]
MTRRGGYVGWALPEAERARLLALFPARYGRTVAHHVTLAHGVGARHPLPTEREGTVLGLADDGESVQALVVAIAGTTDRPGGGTYHVTWSLGPDRRAVDSNGVIARLGWTPVEPVAVRLEPRFFPL